MKNVLITCAQTPFGQALAQVFEREGYRVFSPDNDLPDALDFLVDTTDFTHPADIFTVTDGIDTDVIAQVYRQNVIGPMATLEGMLPLLDAGEGKRLCYISGARASINETRDTKGYAYNMSKAGLHQFLQLVSNKLTPMGYTFRVYDPMGEKIAPQAAAEGAFHYFTRRRGTENFDIRRDDENNLAMRDAEGRLHGW